MEGRAVRQMIERDGFSVRFFQPVYSVRRKITSKSFAQKFELKGSLGDPLSKLCATPPFSSV
jgi:hypothetical protein